MEADELHQDGDVNYCDFHLSIDHPRKHTIDVDSFNAKVFGFINASRNKDRIIDLCGVQFPGPISFDGYAGVNRLPEILFSHARFRGKASFRSTYFSSAANFFAAEFKAGADFSEAKFAGTAEFQRLKFHGPTSFHKADFYANAYFMSALFDNAPDFSDAQFRAYVNFTNARFDKHTSGSTNFSQARLVGGGDFSNTHFGTTARFKGAEFSGPTRYEGTIFNGPAIFGDATFGGDVLFRLAQFRSVVIFRRVKFASRVRFSNEQFVDTTDFNNAVFNVAPEFHGSALHQDTNFAGAKFYDHVGTDVVDAARAYRTLKLAMEQVRATREQAMFFRHEQRSLRLRPDTPRALKVISWLYEIASDYGESPLRPLVGLLLALVPYFLIYLAIQTTGKPILRWADFSATLFFTAQQVFTPFRVFFSDPPTSLGLALLGAIHSLTNIGFITLFIIALRRKFRLV